MAIARLAGAMTGRGTSRAPFPKQMSCQLFLRAPHQTAFLEALSRQEADMSTMTAPRAVLGVKKRNVPGVIFRAQAMYDGFSAHTAELPAPPIALAVFLVLLKALVVAQQATVTKQGPTAATQRNVARDALWVAMDFLRAYLQGQCDLVGSEAAGALILGAGLCIAESCAPSPRPILAATLTHAPGVVHLEAGLTLLAGRGNRAKKTTFHWQWSDDGVTWHDVASTPYARTDIAGFAPFTTIAFRVRVTAGDVTGPWTDPVRVLVLA
jgi:hypothetical protein